MAGRGDFSTKYHHNQERRRAAADYESNTQTKRVLATIHQINEKKLRVTAWMNLPGGGRRLWGNGQEVSIIDSPLDLLMRFGGLKPGMVIEITSRGTSETSTAFARVLAEQTDSEKLRNGEEIPSREVKRQSSLPFEPFGLL